MSACLNVQKGYFISYSHDSMHILIWYCEEKRKATILSAVGDFTLLYRSPCGENVRKTMYHAKEPSQYPYYSYPTTPTSSNSNTVAISHVVDDLIISDHCTPTASPDTCCTKSTPCTLLKTHAHVLDKLACFVVLVSQILIVCIPWSILPMTRIMAAFVFGLPVFIIYAFTPSPTVDIGSRFMGISGIVMNYVAVVTIILVASQPPQDAISISIIIGVSFVMLVIPMYIIMLYRADTTSMKRSATDPLLADSVYCPPIYQ